MDELSGPKPKRRSRWVWVLLLFIPLGFGHWYITAALLLASVALSIVLSHWSRGD
jgi:hypothetical protein